MYALDRASRDISAPFEALSEKFGKLRRPQALACALYHRKKWGVENCARVYNDVAVTPFKDKKTYVLEFVRHVLNYEELWRFGVQTNNLRAQRISLARSRVAEAKRLQARATFQENAC